MRHKILTGLGALLLVGFIGSAIDGGNSTTPTSDTNSAAPAATSSSSTTTTSSTSSTTPAAPATSSTTTTTTATKTTPPPKPKPFKTVSARTFAKIVKNPDAYKGLRIIVYAEVFQFDAATGDTVFLANVGNTKKRPEYGYVDFTDRAMFQGYPEKLDDVVEGDLLTIKATVVGSFSYDTQIGGNTTVPQFLVSSLARYGSTK